MSTSFSASLSSAWAIHTRFSNSLLTWGPTIGLVGLAIWDVVQPILINRKLDAKEFEDARTLAKDCIPEVFANNPLLRKDLVMYPGEGLRVAAAIGGNLPSICPKAMLVYNEYFREISEDAFRCICKHESSHTYHSDALVMTLSSAAIAAISTKAIPYMQSLLPSSLAGKASFIPLAVAVLSLGLISTTLEGRADDFAFANATLEELRGFECFILGWIQTGKIWNKKIPILFSAEGNNRLDFLHPSLTSRLVKVQAAIQATGAPQKEADPEIVAKFRQYYLRALVYKYLPLHIRHKLYFPNSSYNLLTINDLENPTEQERSGFNALIRR